MLRIRTRAMVVEIARSPVLFELRFECRERRDFERSDRLRRAGRLPPRAARRQRRYSISGLSSAKRRNGISVSWSSEIGRLKRSRNS